MSFFVALAFTATEIPGCNPYSIANNKDCGAGETYWKCSIKPTPCHMAYVNFVCAGDEQQAIKLANEDAIRTLKPQDQDIQGTTCVDSHSPKWGGESGDPELALQDDPSACAATTDDDVCVACAKTSCCLPYQACINDSTCVCFVYCLYSGNTLDTCTMDENCGAINDVSQTIALCLNNACLAPCTTGMSSMCGPMGSTGSGGPPPCTGGPYGSGEACFANDDCASCVCNVQTQQCD